MHKTFLRRPLWLLSIVVLVAGLFAALPSAAFAETFDWTRTYFGPPHVPNPNPELEPIPVAAAFNAVSFADAGHGWAVGRKVYNVTPQYGGTSTGFFAFTSDGGSSWTSGTVGTKELHAVTAVSSSNVWAVGSSGTIAHWNGAGAWSTSTVSKWDTRWTGTYALRGVAFTDATHGWAVGDGGGIVRTSDGGSSWSIVTAPTSTGKRLRAIAVVDPATCIAVGDGGATRRLTTSAQPVPSGTTQSLYGVAFADANHGWAVGNGPTVVRTSDGGRTWAAAGALPMPDGVYTPSSRAARAVTFTDTSTGVVVGAYQVVWRTVNGGDTWVASEVPDAGTTGDLELRGVTFLPGDSASLVVVGRTDASSGLSSDDDKARAYRGSWTGRVPAPPAAPSGVTLADAGGSGPRIAVTWTDLSGSEDGFAIERSSASAPGVWSHVQTTTADVTTWTDTSADWGSTWTYRVRAYRGSLYSGWVTSAGFRLDTAPPVTSADVALAYSGSAHIVLAPDDAGSGVATTQWQLDGGLQSTGTVVDTSDVGRHILRFRSIDAVGNEEAWHEIWFYVTDGSVIDSTPPVTSRIGTAWSYHVTPAMVSFSATDVAGSGVLTTVCRVNGGSPVETTTVSLVAAGSYTVEYWSIDRNANIEATRTIKFTVLTRPSSKGYPTTPMVPATITHGKSFTTYGYVKYHTSGTYPVTLYFYRYKSGKYVYYKSVTAKASTISVSGPDFSKYAGKTSVPYTGKWRVRAKHVVSGHSYYSSYTTFTAN